MPQKKKKKKKMKGLGFVLKHKSFIRPQLKIMARLLLLLLNQSAEQE